MVPHFAWHLIAPEGILNRELKSRALAEVTQNLRDAMGAEDDDDASGVFAIYEQVPSGHWANGGKILPLSELLGEMGGNVSEERKREMKTLFDGKAALEERFGISPGLHAASAQEHSPGTKDAELVR